MTPLAYSVKELPELSDTSIRILQLYGIDPTWVNESVQDMFKYIDKRIEELMSSVDLRDIVECYKKFFAVDSFLYGLRK